MTANDPPERTRRSIRNEAPRQSKTTAVAFCDLSALLTDPHDFIRYARHFGTILRQYAARRANRNIVVNGAAHVTWDACMGYGVCEGQFPEGAVTLVRDEAKGVPMDVSLLRAEAEAA
jgi:hypothetical protein